MSIFTRRRSTRSRYIATVLFGAALVAACSPGTSSNNDAEGAIRVATIPGISSLPIQIAITQGFFENHGVDVQLTEGSDVAAWQSALGKQFDIVLSNASSYTWSIDKGLDNSLVNGMVNATPDFSQNSLAAQDPITSYTDLEGATIGVPTLTGLPAQALEFLLQDAGVAKGGYQLVSMPYGVHTDNLAAGNVDAVLTAKPHEEALKRAGFWVDPHDVCVAAIEIASSDNVNTCSSVVFAANTVWANENSAAIEGWLAALNDAIEFTTQHPDEARSVLQSWTGYSDELISDTVLPTYDLAVPRDQLEPVWDILVANGAAEGDFPAAAISVWEQP